VLVRVTSTAIIGGFTALLALVALGVLVRMKVNSAWLVAFGILIGVAHAVIV
jgi:hypothetical protein